MATKKKTKKTLTKSEPKQEKRMPEVGPSDYTFVMSTSEVLSLVQILSFSRDIFRQMAVNCGLEGDAKGEASYAAKSELSEILFSKIRLMASIGEPTSRAIH